MHSGNEPYIFSLIRLVRVVKHVKLCSFISKVLFPALQNTFKKYLNLLCVYHQKEKIWIVRKTSKHTHLKWQMEFSKFLQLKQHKMEFLRYYIYTKWLSMKIARSLFGVTIVYIGGFVTSWSQRPTSFKLMRNPTFPEGQYRVYQ